jgi:hypothetical protein
MENHVGNGAVAVLSFEYVAPFPAQTMCSSQKFTFGTFKRAMMFSAPNKKPEKTR